MARRQGRTGLAEPPRSPRRTAPPIKAAQCSASTCTFRSVRRSAATAISTAGCSTPNLKTRYVAALEREIRVGAAFPSRRPGPPRDVDSIFFGGGTPSLLEPSEIATADRGVPFELRPRRRTRRSRSKPIRRRPRRNGSQRSAHAGVNRISFGVQSFDDEELARLGRIHSAQRARAGNPGGTSRRVRESQLRSDVVAAGPVVLVLAAHG